MGRAQRVKGAGGERELATLLSDLLGRVVKRRLGQSREGGHDITVGKFIIEVKRHERAAIWEWCEQAEAAAKGDDVPVVVFRRNGDEWRACLRLTDLIPLMRGELGGVGDGNEDGRGGERGIGQRGGTETTASVVESGAGETERTADAGADRAGAGSRGTT